MLEVNINNETLICFLSQLQILRINNNNRVHRGLIGNFVSPLVYNKKKQ